jgi:uncharacterized protein
MILKSNFVGKYPIIGFVLLTFFISHVLNPIIVEFLRILFPDFSFDFAAARLNERSLINQYGGSIAALLITLRLYGVHGLKSMLRVSRITIQTAFCLLSGVLLPLIMILLSYYFAGVSLGALLTILQHNFPFYVLIIAGFILSAGLAEEFGWRGFLLPQLLKTQKPLTATFITFFILSLWHFPALLAGWKNEPVLPWLILSLAIAIVHSWFFFKSKGNLLVVIIFHACFDAQYSFFSKFVTGVSHIPFHQGWTYIILYCLLSLVIMITTKGSLGYNKANINLSTYFGEGEHGRPTQASMNNPFC